MTTTEANPSTEPAADENAEPVVPAATAPTETALTVSEQRIPQAVKLPTGELLDQVQAWGRLMARSGYFKDASHEAQAAVKVLFGLELGFTPGASMAGVHIIEGKPTLSASLQAQALRRSGRYDYRVVELDNERCTIRFFEVRGQQLLPIGESEFTIEDAGRANLLGRSGQMWEKYPRNMLFARALTNGITFYCPDAFDVGRVYTADELRPDLELTQDGTVIDVSAITVEPAPEAGQRRPPQRQQQSRERAPRVEQNPTVEPSPEGINNVGALLTYGINLRKFHGLPPEPTATFKALGVEVVGEIAGKYNGDWAAAAQKIRDAFQPTSEHVAQADAGEQPALEAEVEPTVQGRALTPEESAQYKALVDGGLEDVEALRSMGLVE